MVSKTIKKEQYEKMNNKSRTKSKRTQELIDIANELVRECPKRLGQEVLIIGSVGMGIADDDSDIDLELWVDEIPDFEDAIEWIKRLFLADIIKENEKIPGEVAIVFRYEETWVEINWQKISEKEELVKRVLTGDSISRLENNQIFSIHNAIVLRTAGLIDKIRKQLSNYPDEIRAMIIKSSTAFWNYPHRVEMLWGLARREEILGLTTWLQADIEDTLRILFAINRQWETDWKHINHVGQYLEKKPNQLSERIHEVFSHVDLEKRVSTAQLLILDVLQLVPKKFDVSKAIENIQQSLEKNQQQPNPA